MTGLSKAEASDVRTVARGGAVQIVGQVTQRGLSFLFFIVAFRVLGKGGYGLYRQVSQVGGIAAQLGLLGFNYAGMRFISKARAGGRLGEVRGAMRVAIAGAMAASAVALVALILLAGRLASAFGDSPEDVGELEGLLHLAAVYIPLYALMQVLRYCTQAYKTMVPSVMTGNVIQPAARFVLGVGVLAAGFGVTGAVSSLVASVGVACLAGGFYVRRMLTTEERAAPIEYPARPMIRFALPQAGASLLGVQTLGLGIILLGLYSTDASVGLFAAALSLQGPGTVFLGGIVNIWAPVVSDLHERGELDRLEGLYQTINRWIATFSFPVFALLIIEPDLFVRLFAGEQGAGAARIVAILAAGNFFYTGTGPTGYVLSMTGRPGVNFINSIAGVSLYALGGIILVPRYGIVGMAIVDAVVTSLINIVRVIEAKILVGVQPFGRSFAKPVLATIAGAIVLLAARYLPGAGTLKEIASVVVAAFVYIAVLKRLGLDEQERYVLARIKKRALKRGGKNDEQ
ncbi:MAG TPA: oligosaccharide flippase family protein [Actinomycetota bacterium]|nr:oligosaccharide flippase family protein [Actinomycetota bacterium]